MREIILIVYRGISPLKFDSSRYIHRFTNYVSDTGLVIPSLRQIAFVQLDFSK